MHAIPHCGLLRRPHVRNPGGKKKTPERYPSHLIGLFPTFLSVYRSNLVNSQVRLPAVFYPNVILASVLYMLALAARAVQRM